MKKFKISDIEVVNVYRDGGTFKPHYMYKDGNKVLAETYEQHVNLGKAGYIHKMEDGGKMALEEALTDYSVQELPEHLEHMANAEVEEGEFLKYPNEKIAKVKGETHENGGVDTYLPGGTEVLSHNLKIPEVLKNRLNKEMNLGLKTGATQADAMTAYDRVSGYTKLNQEQEELFATLDNLDSKDKTTQAVNERYLNEKIFKIENQKKQLEGDRVKLFDRLFANQELGKMAKEEGNTFIAKYGGMKKSGKLKEIASKYGISEDKAYMLLGGEKSYKDGGTIPDRYKNKGFTKVGVKKQAPDGAKHKWEVLAKKGDNYRIVKGGYRGMDDFSQHKNKDRQKRFWDRMGGKNSAKAKDPFSPLYWHKKFGTWEDGGVVLEDYEDGGTVNLSQLRDLYRLQLIDINEYEYLRDQLREKLMTPEQVWENVQANENDSIIVDYLAGDINEEQVNEKKVAQHDQEIADITQQEIDEFTEMVENPQAGFGYQQQSETGAGTFGRFTEEEAKRMGYYQEYLPTIYDFVKDGNYSYDNVMASQLGYNQMVDQYVKYLKDQGASQSQINTALNQKFTQKEGEARVSDIDGKPGNYWSSRGAMVHKFYDKEKTDKLLALGIHNLSQLDENDERIRDILTDKDIQKFKDVKSKYGGIDFVLAPINEQVAEEPKTQKFLEPVSYFNFTDKRVRPQERVGLVFPDQYVAPVSGLEPLMAGRVRMGRVEPVKVGIEKELRETNRAHNQLMEQLNEVPDSQRAAMLTAIGVSETINKAFVAANKLNQNAIQQADLTNVRQADTENLTNMNLALQYQKEMLTAKAKQEQNVKNFLTKKDQIANQRFYQTVDLNNILANTPDVTTDIFGRATFDPSIDYSLPYRTVQGTVTPTDGGDWGIMHPTLAREGFDGMLAESMANNTRTRTGEQLPQETLDHNHALADILRGGGSARQVSSDFYGDMFEIYDRDGNYVGDYSV